MYISRERFLAALGACALGAGLLTPAAPAQQRQQEEEPPSLTTWDVMNIPNAASYEYANKRAEARARAVTEAAGKASKGYLRVVSPSGFAFERPESWQPVDIQASGAPGEFRSEAIFQDQATGAVLTSMSFDRTAGGEALDIGDKATVDKVLNLMLNPGNDSKAAVKVIKRETGEEAENGSQWVRVKAEGVSQAEGGASVPATFWVQMSQTKALLAVVAVAFPSEQKAAAVPAFHSVRTLEVLNAGRDSAAGEQQGQQPEPAPGQKDGAGGVRKP
jgi:hypothetical protein